jgi:hypothetical protein
MDIQIIIVLWFSESENTHYFDKPSGIMVHKFDTHSILAGWKNHCCQLFNVNGVDVVRVQTAVHTAEPPLPEPTGSEFRMAFENRSEYTREIQMKKFKSAIKIKKTVSLSFKLTITILMV